MIKMYVLKDKKYDKPAVALLGNYESNNSGMTLLTTPGAGCSFDETGTWYEIFKKEGVLDLWFEELKPEPKYKPGDWVIVSRSSTIHNEDAMIIVPKSCTWTPGFSFSNEWCSQFNYENTKNRITRKATDEEVEARLIKEWEERGGGLDARFIPAGDDGEYTARQGSDYVYEDGKLYVSGYGKYLIFDGTNWAEIDAVRLPEIQGYPAKDNGNSLSWGCQSINKRDITPAAIRLARMVLGNRVTMGEFDRVVEYIESRQ